MKNKKSIRMFLSFMLSILMVGITVLGSSIVVKAAPVNGQVIADKATGHLGKPYVMDPDNPSTFG